jgi:hypothetical protein
MERSVELLPRDLRLDALDSLKPLFIEMLDARKLHLCIGQHDFELFRRHDSTVTAV